jgi:hypothetical protein
MIISGTGPRKLISASKEYRHHISESITAHLKNLVRTEVLSGGQEGFDEALSFIAMRCELPLHLAIPNRGFGQYYWEKNSLLKLNRIRRFREMIEYAENTGSVTYVMEDCHKTNELYLDGVHSNYIRNQYLISSADFFLVNDPSVRSVGDFVRRLDLADKPYEEIIVDER